MKTERILLWAALLLCADLQPAEQSAAGPRGGSGGNAHGGGHGLLSHQRSADREQVEAAAYHYMPCRDADVWIRAEELSVNGKSYGRLKPGESVLVDHGVVSIEPAAAH